MQRASRSGRYGWINEAGGYGVNDRGQTTISLGVLIETPALQAFVRRFPRGLVALESTFRPVGS